MSTISWINAAGGDWNVGANWSGGVTPAVGDDAVIALPGTYDILSQSASNAARSVAMSDPDANVLFNISTLALGGALVLNAGTFSLGGDGTIAGGTIDLAGGTFVPALLGNATLSGVTIEGTLPLDMAAFFALSITNGLTLEGAGGSGPGTIDLVNGNLDFVGSQIVAGGSIVLGQTATAYSITFEQSGPGALTLAPDATVVSAGIAEAMFGTVLNQGMVSVLAGADLSVNGWLINAGTLAIAPGGVLTVNGTLTNLATFTGSGGFIDAMGSVTAGDLQNFGSSGAMVVLGSTLDNAGGTLSVEPGGAVPLLTLGVPVGFGSTLGEIDGGIIQDPQGSLVPPILGPRVVIQALDEDGSLCDCDHAHDGGTGGAGGTEPFDQERGADAAACADRAAGGCWDTDARDRPGGGLHHGNGVEVAGALRSRSTCRA